MILLQFILSSLVLYRTAYSALSFIFAGTVLTYGVNPIQNTIANKNQTADYSFFFVPETTIPLGGYVQVTFPSQFTSGLGFSTTTPTCSVVCSLSGYIVTFTVPTAVTAGNNYTVTVQGVLNPLYKGGTGSFILRTLKGVNVLDENLIFSVIGVADTIQTLQSPVISLGPVGSSNAGTFTTYYFQFKIITEIPAGSYFCFTIGDTGFSLPLLPECQPYEINGVKILGQFSCQTVGNNIFVYGLQEDLLSGSYVGMAVSMGNPTVVKTTSTFTIATFRANTTVIYDQRSAISGVTITAGLINNISLVQVDPNALAAQGKVMDYILKFTPTNQLLEYSVVSIEFPPTFVLVNDSTQMSYVMYGLEDVDEYHPLGFNISSNIITLSYYLTYETPQQIAIYFRATNPSNSGLTTALKIRTWTDYLKATLMDEDIVTATVTILSYPCASSTSVTSTYSYADGSATNIALLFTPTLEIPVNGIIKVRVPADFGWSGLITASNVVIASASGSSFSPSTLVRDEDLITIQIPLPTGGGTSLPTSGSSTITFTGVFTTPTYNSTFKFDVTTMSDEVTILESWTSILTILPQPFPSAPVMTSIISTQGVASIVDVSFTTSNTIPTGDTQYIAHDQRGFIEFAFNVDTLNANLGWTAKVTGDLVPCKSIQGVVAVLGETLECTLDFSSTSKIGKIIMRKFQEISAGTFVKVRFPNFLNPNKTLTLTVKTFSKQDRIWSQLNLQSVNYTPGAASSVTSTTVANSQYTFSGLSVPVINTVVNLNFNSGFTSSTALGSVILIQLPTDWIPNSDVAANISCNIAGNVKACIGYEEVNWITIELSSSDQILATDLNWTLSNIQTPIINNTSPGSMVISVITNNVVNNVYQQNTFPISTTPAFADSTLIVPNKGLGFIDASYTITLRLKNPIPQGSSIAIEFSTDLNLLKSSPSVYFGSSTLVDISALQPVTYTAAIAKLTVTNFAAIAANTVISITAYGIKNPSSGTLSTGWNVYINYNSGTIAYEMNFDQFAYTTAFSSGNIVYKSISSYPCNADEYADTTIAFTPQTGIPVGGQILITFPTEYKALPTTPDCYVTGGFTTFQSCVLSGSTITITTDTQYTTGGLSIMIRNVLNPDAGTTSGFNVTTMYDGVYLDTTDASSTVGRVLTAAYKANPIDVQTLTFDPQNEGEIAAYNFTFLPSDYIEATMDILVIFPDDYDKLLGHDIACAVIGGLLGTITCSVSSRIVTITGYDTYEPDTENPVSFAIYGVVNPNRGSTTTGEFKIATVTSGDSTFVDYESSAGTLTILPAPGWSYLYDIQPENQYTRLDSDYVFNFTTTSIIPRTSSSGAVYVDLPDEFDVDDQDMTCSTTTTDFAALLTCKILRNRVIINGQTSDYTGNIVFTVRSLLNPVDEGMSGIIYVKTYDGVNKRIVQRSYKNLDPFSFAYTYPGPLIIVNGDADITMDRGTQCDPIPITVDYPCALNLTLKPVAAPFSIIPFNSEMSLGMVQVTFRISIPEAFYSGTYYINWETLGETIPALYTPIRRTTVVVTQNTGIVISVPAIPTVPYGGNSLPIEFTVPSAPDIEIEIAVNFKTAYIGLSLSSNTVTFAAGSKSATFLIYSSNDNNVTGGVIVSGGEVVLDLSGVDSDIYTLSTTSMLFTVGSADNVAPTVTSVTFHDITQTAANATVVVSELSRMYYMMALKGTSTPKAAEMMSLGPAAYTTTRSTYNVLTTPTSLTCELNFTNLEAEVEWEIYIYLMDRGNNGIATTFTQSFVTQPRYNAANVGLRFKQVYLPDKTIEYILESVAFILSLWPNKIQEQKYILNSNRLLEEEDDSNYDKGSLVESKIAKISDSRDRMLQVGEVTTVLNIQILTVPVSEAYPSPKLLAQSLVNKTDDLSARLENFDPSYPINAFEFVRYTPKFVSTPVNIGVGRTWGAFTGKLDTVGFIFCVAIEKSSDSGIPSPYQIWLGYDSFNIPQGAASVEVSSIYEEFSYNVTGLIPLTDYIGYMVAGSVHPGYPDLGDATKVLQVAFRTDPALEAEPLNINHEGVLELPLTMLIIATIAVFFY